MAVDTKTRNLILLLAVTFVAGFALHWIMAPQSQHLGKQVILAEHAPKPIGPYSQAVQSGDFVFISGQIGINPKTGNLSPTLEGQTVQIMENIRAILQEAGLD